MVEAKTPEFLGTGRRKTSVARVRLTTGTGKVTVNGRALEHYFPMDSLRMLVLHPLTLTGTAEKFDARVSVGAGDLHGVSLGAVWVH